MKTLNRKKRASAIMLAGFLGAFGVSAGQIDDQELQYLSYSSTPETIRASDDFQGSYHGPTEFLSYSVTPEIIAASSVEENDGGYHGPREFLSYSVPPDIIRAVAAEGSGRSYPVSPEYLSYSVTAAMHSGLD